MSIELSRGRVTQIGTADKSGAVECSIGGKKIKVHKHLLEDLDSENEILVGGVVKNGVLHAYALRNVKKEKTLQVESANYILLAGLGAYLGIMFGIFFLQGSNDIGVLAVFQAAMSIVSFVSVGWAMRRFMTIFNTVSVVKAEMSEFL